MSFSIWLNRLRCLLTFARIFGIRQKQSRFSESFYLASIIFTIVDNRCYLYRYDVQSIQLSQR